MKRIFVLLTLSLLLAGCREASREPVVTGYRIQQVGGLGLNAGVVNADVVLALDVDNPSRSRYTVESLQAVLYKESETGCFAEAEMKGTAEIAPGTGQTVSIPLELRILRPLALLAGGLEGFDLSQYCADIDLTVRKAAFRKKIRKERVPLSRLVRTSEQDKTNETE